MADEKKTELTLWEALFGSDEEKKNDNKSPIRNSLKWLTTLVCVIAVCSVIQTVTVIKTYKIYKRGVSVYVENTPSVYVIKPR